jgi:hypothetical protein
MQNAADAGALAGARELCFGWPAIAEATAWDYANRNGGVNITVDITDYVVTVQSRIDARTYFAAVIGIDTVDIGAEAQAACGDAKSACGLWPVALDEDRWHEVSGAGCGEETPFYVWAGDNPNQQPDCYDPATDTGIHDCDLNDDGLDDMVEMVMRAWLDFSDVVDPEFPDDCTMGGCGASELACWIENDSGAMITLPDCIAGDPGVRSGVKDEVDDRRGDLVAIPLFDRIDCHLDEGEVVTCPGTSVHAVDFGCIRVEGWVHNLKLPRVDGENPPWKGHAIKAHVPCPPETCDTFCGGTIGGPPQYGGVKAVSLIR